MNLFGRFFLVFASAAISGCSWLAPEEPVQPVSPLEQITAPVQGQLLWSRDIGGDTEFDTLRPSLENGRILIASEKGVVASVDAVTGSLAWQQDIDARISGGVGAGMGLALVGTPEGVLVALDQQTGAERWRQSLTSALIAAPAAGQGIVVARTNDGKIVGLSAADGSPVWTFEREVPVLSLRGESSPVVAGTQVLCGLDVGKVVALDISTGRPDWEATVAYPTGRSDLDRVVDIDGDPLVAGDAVFVTSYQGYMTAISRSTGGAGWSIPFSSYTGLAADSRTLYASDDRGYLWAIDPSTGNVLWTQKALSGRRLSMPAATGGWAAVGDLEGYLHWIEPETGEIRGRTRATGSEISQRILASGNVVYVTDIEGELVAVRAPSR